MPRAFDGISDTAAITVDLSPYSAATFAGAFFGTIFTTGSNKPFFEYANPAWTSGGCILDPNAGLAPAVLISFSDAAGANQWTDTFPRPNNGEWHHYVVAYDRANTVNKAWLDGTPQALTTISHAVAAYGNFANSSLNLMCRNHPAPSLFQVGRAAEVGVWGGTILSDSDAQQLSNGVSPPFIRSDSLLFYVPLGFGSPDPDYFGARRSATLTGTTVTTGISPLWLGMPPH